MHHPDSAGDSSSVRKMAHPANFSSRASNTSGSGSTLATSTHSAVINSHIPVDDYQSSLLIQSQPPLGSSSPGPQHHPHSLSLTSQPQPAQPTGAQIKKKSGFQITSVTPAQISVSSNNSIAEDTESYDDLDESHTEDLSSSEILDVSLTRPNDIPGGERSSSEETLNNFHEADTPGAISPNQPQHGGALVNGNVHHHHHSLHSNHHPHLHQAQTHPSTSSSVGVPSAQTPGALPTSVGQKLPSNMGVTLENASCMGPSSAAAQPNTQGMGPGMHSTAAGPTVSIGNPLTSNVSNVKMLSSTNVPAKAGINGTTTASANRAAGASTFPTGGMMSASGASQGVSGSSGCVIHSNNNNHCDNSPNVTYNHHHQQQQHQQRHQSVNSAVTMTSSTVAASSSMSMGVSGGAANSRGMTLAGVTSPPASVPVPVSSHVQPAPAPAPATTSSRFRVVKLDSSSEPFKKGRWVCTEFYDKDNPAPTSSSSAAATVVSSSLSEASGAVGMGRAGESARQFVPEVVAAVGAVVGQELDSASGSSVSSTVSTLSHHTESAGSSEGTAQRRHDFNPPPHGFQAPLPGGLSMGVHKTTMAPSVPASIRQPIPINTTGLPTTVGHPGPGVPQHQLTYAQAAATQVSGSAQGLAGAIKHNQHHQMGYAASASLQAAPAHIRPLSQGGSLHPEYAQQTHPGSAVPQTHGAGPGQMMGGPPQQQPQSSMTGPILQQQQAQVQALSQGLIQPQHPQASGAAGGMVTHMSVASMGLQPQSHPGPPLDQRPQPQQSLHTQTPAHVPQLPNSAVHPTTGLGPPSNVPPPLNAQSDPQQLQAQNVGSSGNSMIPHTQAQPPRVGLAQDFAVSQAQALAHAQAVTAQTSALYASLPTFTATQLEDAQRLLLQHQSALLGLQPKLAAGEVTSAGAALGLGQGTEASAAAVSALTASAGLFKAVEGEEDGSSGASVVAIDNKIEQAMDLVKSHLMYAVREEVEVLKEQIKELIDRNSQLEQENTLLKTLASPEQMAQFQAQVQTGSPPLPTPVQGSAPSVPQQSIPAVGVAAQTQAQPASHVSGPSA